MTTPTSRSAADANPFAGLMPVRLWELFAELTTIPRPSRKEEAVLAWVDAWAAGRGFEIRHDAIGNRLVRVPGTAGRESAPIVALQAHVDMVSEKHSWSTWDPDAGRILIQREGDWLTAPETTLGADNGIGVVLMMYIAESTDVPHGPLELLFTVDEETGLTGAAQLDPSLITAPTLLTLDSEEDGILYIGCAGGADTTLHWKGQSRFVPDGWRGVSISVTGLVGGHSGGEIHLDRGNSLKILARTLREIGVRTPFCISAVSGGNKRNAIPREARAELALPPGPDAMVRVGEAVAASLEAARGHYATREPSVAITSLPGAPPASVNDEASTKQLVALLSAIPNGVLAMSQSIPGLVETSTNLAVVTTKPAAQGGEVSITSSSRSSDRQAMEEAVDTLASIGALSGCRIESFDKYGGWKPAPESNVVRLAAEVHLRLFGVEAPITAIHAGLECGLFAEKFPKIDMVSFGPDIRGPHAPGERVSISSTAKFVRWLGGVLTELSGERLT
ncbi:MAG: beta-Ala-His dipeptidase [Candidatus Eisenbacteria bacterium]|nr:beta-Ala-His dipeptidase [Candidatus Eisenbacteria bacterium]